MQIFEEVASSILCMDQKHELPRKIKEPQLRWFGHIMVLRENKTIKRVFEAKIKKMRGRPKKPRVQEV